jgi:hypothetical protein
MQKVFTIERDKIKFNVPKLDLQNSNLISGISLDSQGKINIPDLNNPGGGGGSNHFEVVEQKTNSIGDTTDYNTVMDYTESITIVSKPVIAAGVNNEFDTKITNEYNKVSTYNTDETEHSTVVIKGDSIGLYNFISPTNNGNEYESRVPIFSVDKFGVGVVNTSDPDSLMKMTPYSLLYNNYGGAISNTDFAKMSDILNKVDIQESTSVLFPGTKDLFINDSVITYTEEGSNPLCHILLIMNNNNKVVKITPFQLKTLLEASTGTGNNDASSAVIYTLNDTSTMDDASELQSLNKLNNQTNNFSNKIVGNLENENMSDDMQLGQTRQYKFQESFLELNNNDDVLENVKRNTEYVFTEKDVVFEKKERVKKYKFKLSTMSMIPSVSFMLTSDIETLTNSYTINVVRNEDYYYLLISRNGDTSSPSNISGILKLN